VWSWAKEAPQNFGFSYNIFANGWASDFKFGAQLGFAEAHHKITRRRKDTGLGELLKILRFHFNINTMADAMNFKLVHSIRLPRPTTKSHQEEMWAWPWARHAPIYLGFPFIISSAASLSP